MKRKYGVILRSTRSAELLLLAILTAWLPLSAMDFGLDMGFSRNGMITEDSSSPAQESQTTTEARNYVGIAARQAISSRMKLGARLIYSRRDFGEPSSGLKVKGGYLDLMLHPVIRLRPMELYGGPTLAFRLGGTVSGLPDGYDEAAVKEMAGFVPGFHAGVRIPDDIDAPFSFNVSYNRDLLPYSEALGSKKHQEKVMLGVHVPLGKRPKSVFSLWRGFERIPTEQRVNMGLGMSAKAEDFIFGFNSAYELVKRIGPLGLGAELAMNAGSVMADDFGVWMNLIAGPQAGFKLGEFEPYYQVGWGVVASFFAKDDRSDNGLRASNSWETGLRMHLSDEVALDFRYNESEYYQRKNLRTFGIGVSVN